MHPRKGLRGVPVLAPTEARSPVPEAADSFPLLGCECTCRLDSGLVVGCWQKLQLVKPRHLPSLGCPQVKEDVGSATGRAALNGRQTHQNLDPSSWEARIRKEPALQRAGLAVEPEKTTQGPGAPPGEFPAATQRVGHSAPLPCLRSLDTWLLPGPAHVRWHRGVPLCALPVAPASSDPTAACLLWVQLGQAAALHTSPYVLPEWSLLLELLRRCLTVTTWLFPGSYTLETSFLDSVPSTAFLGRFSVPLGSEHSDKVVGEAET